MISLGNISLQFLKLVFMSLWFLEHGFISLWFLSLYNFEHTRKLMVFKCLFSKKKCICWYILQENTYFCNILWLVLKSARLVIEISHDKKIAWKLDQSINHLMQINICYRCFGPSFAQTYDQNIHHTSVDLHQKFNIFRDICFCFGQYGSRGLNQI